MKCANCNNDVNDSWKVCPFCGEEIVKELNCKNCDFVLDKSWKVCPNCGDKTENISLNEVTTSQPYSQNHNSNPSYLIDKQKFYNMLDSDWERIFAKKLGRRIYKHDIDDILNITELKIDYIDLKTNNISVELNLEPLSYLRKMKSFEYSNYMSELDLSLLSDCTELNELVLDLTSVENLKRLTQFPNLEKLYLDSISEEDKEELMIVNQLENLKYLELDNVPFELDFLYPNKNLTHLSLISPNTSNFGFLRQFKRLKYLKCIECYPDNYFPFEYLKELKELHIENSSFDDSEFLDKLPNLKYLTLKNVGMQDITFLKELSQLQYLDCSENDIVDFTIISNLENLTDLNIINQNSEPPSNLKFLNNCQKLQSLLCTISPPIENLNNLPSLKHLTMDLYSNVYEEDNISQIFDPIFKLTNLKTLDLTGYIESMEDNIWRIRAKFEELLAEFKKKNSQCKVYSSLFDYLDEDNN